jgi:hypothetical protein
MLERNKSVLNTYMDIVEEDYDVAITFDDGSEEKTIRPKWLRVYYMETALKEEKPIKATPEPEVNVALGGVVSQLSQFAALAERFNPSVMATIKVVKGTIKTNHTYCRLRFLVVNQGRTPIDDYKISFRFDNQDVRFVYDNVEKKMTIPNITCNVLRNTTLENGQCVNMRGKSIIPEDHVNSDEFFVHLPYDAEEIIINWRLISRHYSDGGRLKLVVEKEYKDDVVYDKEKAGQTDLRDYIEVEDVTD